MLEFGETSHGPRSPWPRKNPDCARFFVTKNGDMETELRQLPDWLDFGFNRYRSSRALQRQLGSSESSENLGRPLALPLLQNRSGAKASMVLNAASAPPHNAARRSQ